MDITSVILIFYAIKLNNAAEYMPVLLLDEKKILRVEENTNYPFISVKSAEFIKIINSATKIGDTLLIFVEEKFSSEDLRVKHLSKSPFKFLKRELTEKKIKYYPFVENPYKTLLRTLPQHQFNRFVIDFTNYKQLDIVSIKYCYIYFKDEPGLRADILAQHDSLIENVYKMVVRQTGKNVLVFYTGISNIYKRNATIQCYNKCSLTLRAGEDPGVFIKAPRSIFFLKGLRKTGSLRKAFRRFPIVDREFTYNNKMTTIIKYADVDLAFDFAEDPRKWSLESITWLMNDTPVGRTNLDIQAPWGKSYSCGQPIVLRNRKNDDVLSIDEYQIELLRENKTTRQEDGAKEDGGQVIFDSAEKCSSYITAGILTCVLLSLLLIIVFWNGMFMLMNVQGNDKFDDPKKPQFFGPAE